MGSAVKPEWAVPLEKDPAIWCAAGAAGVAKAGARRPGVTSNANRSAGILLPG